MHSHKHTWAFHICTAWCWHVLELFLTELNNIWHLFGLGGLISHFQLWGPQWHSAQALDSQWVYTMSPSCYCVHSNRIVAAPMVTWFGCGLSWNEHGKHGGPAVRWSKSWMDMHSGQVFPVTWTAISDSVLHPRYQSTMIHWCAVSVYVYPICRFKDTFSWII